MTPLFEDFHFPGESPKTLNAAVRQFGVSLRLVEAIASAAADRFAIILIKYLIISEVCCVFRKCKSQICYHHDVVGDSPNEEDYEEPG